MQICDNVCKQYTGPGRMFVMMQLLQKECDRQSRKVLIQFRNNREFDEKVCNDLKFDKFLNVFFLFFSCKKSNKRICNRKPVWLRSELKWLLMSHWFIPFAVASTPVTSTEFSRNARCSTPEVNSIWDLSNAEFWFGIASNFSVF